MAARPLSHQQQLQHQAFLKALARTGNVKLSATEAGLSDATLHYRRKRHPDFAQRWDAALYAAKARLYRTGGAHGAAADGARAAGGEPVVTLLANGRLQVRAARRGSLTRRTEQTFLLALSATANVSLSAAAAGASVAAFNRRRRRDPAFAREVRRALAQGYEQIEQALIAGYLPDSHEHDAWRHNEPPPVPPMTPQQALQLLYLHQKRVTLASEEMPSKRRGEPHELHLARVRAAYRARMLKQAEDDVQASLDALAARLPDPVPAPIALPDLAQVTGWSKADAAKGGHSDRALFGGWRSEHQSPDAREAALATGRATPAGSGKRHKPRRGGL